MLADSPFSRNPVVTSTQEAADRQYKFIVCTFKLAFTPLSC